MVFGFSQKVWLEALEAKANQWTLLELQEPLPKYEVKKSVATFQSFLWGGTDICLVWVPWVSGVFGVTSSIVSAGVATKMVLWWVVCTPGGTSRLEPGVYTNGWNWEGSIKQYSAIPLSCRPHDHGSERADVVSSNSDIPKCPSSSKDSRLMLKAWVLGLELSKPVAADSSDPSVEESTGFMTCMGCCGQTRPSTVDVLYMRMYCVCTGMYPRVFLCAPLAG